MLIYGASDPDRGHRKIAYAHAAPWLTSARTCRKKLRDMALATVELDMHPIRSTWTSLVQVKRKGHGKPNIRRNRSEIVRHAVYATH